MPVFRDYSQANRTSENGLLVGKAVTVPSFLRRAPAQSGFNKGSRRMQCDLEAGDLGKAVDFCGVFGKTEFVVSQKPISGELVLG
jgi:hypothetical protein